MYIMNNLAEDVTSDNLMILVSNIILKLGISPHLRGYTYLREAIIIKVNDPHADIPVTKILYPSIAKKFHTSGARVERSIRTAIEVAWGRWDQSSADKRFLQQFFRFDRKPTNSEFIAMIADHIILVYK